MMQSFLCDKYGDILRNNAAVYKTIEAVCVQRNIEEGSCDHCCSGKTMIITQPECVYL